MTRFQKNLLANLSALYGRLKNDPLEGKEIPGEGFSREQVHMALVLDRDGYPIRLESRMASDGKYHKALLMIVPFRKDRARDETPYFLWDKSTYSLGLKRSKKTFKTDPKKFELFREHHNEVSGDHDDRGLVAVTKFLRQWDPAQPERFPHIKDALDQWPKDTDPNIVFVFDGTYILERAVAQSAWTDWLEEHDDVTDGICLVTGKRDRVRRLHRKIKGVKGSQSSGAPLVSFNKEAFESYNNSQGENAPVSRAVALKYAVTLKHLLLFESKRKIFLGPTTVVFWSDRPSQMEELFPALFTEPLPQSAAHGALEKKLKVFLDTVTRHHSNPGALEPDLNPQAEFTVLGLDPNQARLVVGFYYSDTVGHIAERFQAFYRDIEIRGRLPETQGYPSLARLLRSIAVKGDLDRLPRNMLENLFNAIMSGNPIPRSIYEAALTRWRVSRHGKKKRNDRIDQALRAHDRTSLIKAYLIRAYKEDITVSLDENRRDPGYRIGRLFAILENIQQAAQAKPKEADEKEGISSDKKKSYGPGINTTIRDRFFSGVMTSPQRVIPGLISLTNAHLQKIKRNKPPLAVFFERQVGEIILDLDDFPQSLDNKQRGLFTIGYYHQKMYRVEKGEKNESND